MSRRMVFNIPLAALAATVAVAVALAGCNPPSKSASASPVATTGTTPSTDAQPAAQVSPERGRYLVTIGGCHDCHTPWKMGPEGPEPDMSLALSGHPQDQLMPAAPVDPSQPWNWAGASTNTAFAGPWGVSYARNLTPHETTGLGPWSEEIFINTIRSGKHWGQSRPILPPMPWFNYRQMTDEDLKSIWAYLQTLPPIDNEAPASIPAGEAPVEVALGS